MHETNVACIDSLVSGQHGVTSRRENDGTNKHNGCWGKIGKKSRSRKVSYLAGFRKTLAFPILGEGSRGLEKTNPGRLKKKNKALRKRMDNGLHLCSAPAFLLAAEKA